MAQTVENESVSVRDRPRPETDPLGARVGGFDLFARLDLGVTTTDNLFAEETNEDDDIIYSIAPHLRLTSHWSRHQIEADAGGRATMHDDFDNEDAETYYAGIRGRLDIGGNSNVSGGARLAHEVESRTDPDAPTGGDPVEYDITNVFVRGEHTFNRFRVSGTVSHREADYDAAYNFRDNEETALTGRVQAAVSPRLGVVFEVTGDERDYDNFPALNSEGTTLLAGVSVNLTDLMVGEVTVGQFDRDYDGGGSVDGTAVAADLEWYVTRLTTINFNASRRAEDTGSTTVAEPYVEQQLGASVDHELLRNVILSAGVQFGNRSYEQLDRDDDYQTLSVEATYLMNRRVALSARLSRHETESDGADRYRDFDETRFSLGASLRL